MAATNIQSFAGQVEVSSNLTVDTNTLHVDSIAGRVGIGKTNPAFTLDVNGDVNFSGSLYQSGSPFVSSLWTNNGSSLYYNSGNVGIGITAPSQKLHVSGNILATGDVTAFSDKRLKSNITHIKNALDKITQLNGYTYILNETNTKSTGLVAQEVLDVLPEAVHGSEDTQYSLAYGNLMGLVVEAIKELASNLTIALAHIDAIENGTNP